MIQRHHIDEFHSTTGIAMSVFPQRTYYTAVVCLKAGKSVLRSMPIPAIG